MLTHTAYGVLVATPDIKTLIDDAMLITTAAASRGKIPPAFDDMVWGWRGRELGHRIGVAQHHEIFDVTPDGKKVLVCVRTVEGTKYGVKTTCKAYFVVCRHGKGLRVTAANKAVAAKLAKASVTLGAAIAAL